MKGMAVSFRDNLLRLRTENNLTQEQLAELVGVSRQSVAKWESDRSYPEMDKLIKLTGIFGCTLDELVMGPRGGEACDERELAECVQVAEGASGDAVCSDSPKMFALAQSDEGAASDKYGYDAHMRSFSRRIAWGVFAFIAGVACMMFSSAVLQVAGYSDESPLVLCALFAGIVAGLALIIPAAMGHAEFMREHPVINDFYTMAQKREAGSRLALGIVGGIALIFIGVIVVNPGEATGTEPIYNIARVLTLDVPFLVASEIGVGLLLTCVAVAVWCFVYFGIMYSRVHVREYNSDSLGELAEAYGKGRLGPERLIAQLSPEERQLLFDAEGIDGADPEQVRAYFDARGRKDKLIGGVCAIIMIVATIVGLCLLFGTPVYSPYFWMAWVVGALCCGIANVAINTFMK